MSTMVAKKFHPSKRRLCATIKQQSQALRISVHFTPTSTNDIQVKIQQILGVKQPWNVSIERFN